MRHIKKFENFDFGHRFNDEEAGIDNLEPVSSDCGECDDETKNKEETPYGYFSSDSSMPVEQYEEDEEDEEDEKKNWNDEPKLERISSFRSFNEKMNPGFKAYLDKKKAKKDKEEDKEDDKKPSTGKGTGKETTYNKSGLKHPEKADLNKNKKISSYEKVRGKAIQNAVQDEKEEGGTKDDKKGLTTAQKKLPKALQDAILKKKK